MRWQYINTHAELQNCRPLAHPPHRHPSLPTIMLFREQGGKGEEEEARSLPMLRSTENGKDRMAVRSAVTPPSLVHTYKVQVRDPQSRSGTFLVAMEAKSAAKWSTAPATADT